mmetsp:Transcript_21103/g.20273  ORF Transcript_21103/g.20273 Transcript_21103/m.20273 type:complete len:162 (+) Transcript_21103:357-842(+)
MIGLLFSMLAIIIEDIGISLFGTCGVSKGSIMEYLYIIIIVFIWPYSIYSAVKCFSKLRTERNALSDQKQLYICHIANIIIYSCTWMPLNLTHFFNYALKLYPENKIAVQVTLLSLVISTPALNSATRLFFDASLKKKFICSRKSEESNEIIDSLLESENK